jgi:two-component system response regulator NreC
LGRGKRVSQILIADGNLLFRRGLRTLLSAESDLEVVEEVSDTAEALEKVRAISPDLVVMDLALLEGEGQQAGFAIRQAHPNVAILFLTNEDGPEQLERAVNAGARGYMLKNSPPAQLLAGIRQIAFTDDQNPRGLSKIVPDLRALASSNEGYPRGAVLTTREQEVMRLLAEGRTVREVAAELSLSIKTVEAHKLNLMRKLDIHNRASLVEYAMQKGLIAVPVTQPVTQ